MAKPSKTAYDDAFHTMLYACRRLVIPVVNHIFHENYDGHAQIVLHDPKYYWKNEGGDEQKLAADTFFTIISSSGRRETTIRNARQISMEQYWSVYLS